MTLPFIASFKRLSGPLGAPANKGTPYIYTLNISICSFDVILRSRDFFITTRLRTAINTKQRIKPNILVFYQIGIFPSIYDYDILKKP